MFRQGTALLVTALLTAASAADGSLLFAPPKRVSSVENQPKFIELRRMALAGDARAAFELGNCFFLETGRAANAELAVYWFRKAADKIPAAAYNLGVCLERGWGVEANFALAREAYLLASGGGVTMAEVRLAEQLWSGYPEKSDNYRHYPALPADREKALAQLRELGKRGFIPAERAIAEKISVMRRPRPEGMDSERRRALAAVAASAEAGAADLLLYADSLRSGEGGPGDMKQAARLLERAAATGLPDALAAYAEVLDLGEGCPRDSKKALELLQRAAEKHSPRALVKLGKLYLFSESLPCDPAKALECFERSAEAAYPPAYTRLGDCFRDGIGVRRSPRRAFEEYDKGARSGDIEAAYRLGICYRDGFGVTPDPVGAAFWFRSAATGAHTGAVRELGIAMLGGVGITADAVRGRKLLNFAAARGDAAARRILAGGGCDNLEDRR